MVCGLKVKQHPNPDCRAQWVVIEPGYAIDCCGREIFVQDEQMFDFRTRFREVWKEQNGKDSEPDDKSHLIQICVRYKECPSGERAVALRRLRLRRQRRASPTGFSRRTNSMC